MTPRQILDSAAVDIERLTGETIDILDVAKPPDMAYASHLAKVISKLSPLVGNMIEFYIANALNASRHVQQGDWIRQDPGFPDLVFKGAISPEPGIEIKTWFPLATEITARFRDSASHLHEDNTDVVLIAWLPERLIYGKPRIVGVWRDSAIGLARARDTHYHKPPHYLVFEPEDTRARTANLRQTNTNGYVFQGSASELEAAKRDVARWGRKGLEYDVSPRYQRKLHDLRNKYTYRLDTNFAKMDRIQHDSLEAFKSYIHSEIVYGHTLQQWSRRAFFTSGEALRILLE